MSQESAFGIDDAPQIENVEILELLGKGGMSLVYKARQLELDRIVAVKVLSAQKLGGEAGIKRFQNEAKLCGALNHPNIIKTLSFGVSKNNQPYIILEYLEGMSLAEFLKENGRLSLQKFKDTFLPILSALSEAHDAGLVHRDIKPGNIMYCRTGSEQDTVKLVDFGIAKSFAEGENKSAALTATGAILGSPAYMSPEQCQSGLLDNRSDLYSLACVMYESLCGEPPFSGESLLDLMQKHSAAPPPAVPDLQKKIAISKPLAEAILWPLAKNPAERPQSASALSQKLNEALDGASLEQVPVLKKSLNNSTGKMKLAALLLGCALILFLILRMSQSRSLDAAQPKIGSHIGAGRVEKNGETDDYLRSERRYKKQLEICELKKIDKSGLAGALNNLALFYDHEKKPELAEPLFKRLIAMKENEPGYPDNTLTDAYLGLAHCYREYRKWQLAEPIYERLLQIYDSRDVGYTQDLDRVLYDLATCYDYENKPVLALSTGRRLLELRKKNNPEHVDEAWDRLANTYKRHDKQQEALAIYNRLLAKAENEGKDDREIAAHLDKISACYEDLRDYKKALPHRKREVDLVEPMNLPESYKIYRALADDYLGADQPELAEKACRKALAANKDAGDGSEFYTHIMHRLAQAYTKEHRYADAQRTFENILDYYEKIPNGEKGIVFSLDAIKDCCFLQNHLAESIPPQKRALAIREKSIGSENMEIAARLSVLANTYDKVGQKEEGKPLWQRAQAIGETQKKKNVQPTEKR